MRKKPKPASRPTANRGGLNTNSEIAKSGALVRQHFLLMAGNMTWQLALVVLVPIYGGMELDKHLTSSNIYLFIGLALAVVGSALIMWRTMQIANRLPVPKLTAAQKRAIQKSFEDEDKDND